MKVLNELYSTLDFKVISFQLYLNLILETSQYKCKVHIQGIKNECGDYDFATGSLHHRDAL